MSQAYTTGDEWQEFAGAYEKFAEMVASLNGPQAPHFDHGQAEAFVETEGRELLRRMLALI